jgi:hypothetical protein
MLVRQDEGLDSATRGLRKLLKKPQTGLRLRFDFELSASSRSGQELDMQTISSRCGLTNVISRRRAYGGQN